MVFAGDFRVLRPLSQGGMGAVYVVEQLSTGKQRALKLMLPQLVADPALRQRFNQEARIGSLIDSEHVVEVVGAGVDAATGIPWLAMELLNGEDLAHVVERRGALGAEEVLSIFEQLGHALGAAHRAGIVHRDLKPENIFIARSSRVGGQFTLKVLDFGIAKIAAEAKTVRTAAIGTPIWMAPEQTERSTITPATDVWAFGLIAFYVLTGRFFWITANVQETSVPQLMREILFDPLPPAGTRASELNSLASLPAGFEPWFARCLSRDPSARFQEAQEAVAQLRGILLNARSISAAPSGLAQEPARGLEQATQTPATLDFASAQAGGTALASASTLAGARDASNRSSAESPGVPPRAAALVERKTSLFARLLLVSLVAGGVGAGIWARSSRATHAPAGAAATSDPATGILIEAKALLDKGDTEGAVRVSAQIPAASNLRQSADYRAIQGAWADSLFAKASATSDGSQKRALLEQIARATEVDSIRRTRAANELAALGSEPKVVRDNPFDAKPPAAASAKVTGGNLVRKNPFEDDPDPLADRSKFLTAKATLQQKVRTGQANERDLKMLRAVCKQLGDASCSN